MKLPQKLPLDMMQTKWASIIEPIISKPANNGVILKDLTLTAGTNVINHKLGRKLEGWNPTRVRADATFYDLQDDNSTPQLTLILVASADVIIDLMVF